MEKTNIVVIGASAGGFEAIKQLVAGLPPALNAAVFIVWHISPDIRGILPQMLNKYQTLHAAHAVDREPIVNGRIYIAPPDQHLLIEKGIVRVIKGPKENRFRPAVDPLFRSAAYTYNEQVIGIVLSGALDDGTADCGPSNTTAALPSFRIQKTLKYLPCQKMPCGQLT